MNTTTRESPLTDAFSGMSGGAYRTIPYLLLSFSSSPPLHQVIVALGEAWGRHSKTTSPPRWITVAFFTGRRVKSGGEAEEQTRVKVIMLMSWTGTSCASAKMSSAPLAITKIIFQQPSGNEMELWKWKNRGCASARSQFSLFLLMCLLGDVRQEQHNVHTYSTSLSCLWVNPL